MVEDFQDGKHVFIYIEPSHDYVRSRKSSHQQQLPQAVLIRSEQEPTPSPEVSTVSVQSSSRINMKAQLPDPVFGIKISLRWGESEILTYCWMSQQLDFPPRSAFGSSRSSRSSPSVLILAEARLHYDTDPNMPQRSILVYWY